jgi:ADP-heptose:LPS heptosyltransferase
MLENIYKWIIVWLLMQNNKYYKSNKKNLVIANGGIGDSIILIGILIKYKKNVENWDLLTKKNSSKLFEKHLPNYFDNIYLQLDEIEFNKDNYTDIYSIRMGYTDIKELYLKNYNGRFHPNEWYDNARILSRVFSILSTKYKKNYYRKTHISEIFKKTLNIDEKDKINFKKNNAIKINPKTNLITIGIHVGGSEPIRKLKIETIIEIVHLMPDYNFILIGDKEDSKKFSIENFNSNNIAYKIGSVELNHVSELLKDINIVVAPDSMIMHYCDFLNIPLIAIMGNALTETYGPRHTQYKVINRNPRCAPCSRSNCEIFNGYSCIQDINAIEIKKAIESIIKDSKCLTY